MKQIRHACLALGMAVVLALTLTACGDREPTDNGESKDNRETSDRAEATTFSILYNGVRITPGTSASEALGRLGNTLSEPQEVFDCGAGNSRMYYRYASVELYTMKRADGTEIVDQIELKDDLSQTEKGISIGSTESEVRAAYGTPSQEKNGTLTYTSGDQRLILDVKDGKVTNIGLLCVTQ